MSDYVKVTIEMLTDGGKTVHSIEYPTTGWRLRKVHVAPASHACVTGIFGQEDEVKSVLDSLREFEAFQEDA